MRKFFLAAVAAVLATPAAASVFNFSYSTLASDDAVFGQHVAVAGKLTLSDAPLYTGTSIFGITGIMGTRSVTPTGGNQVDTAIDGLDDLGFNDYDLNTHDIEFTFLSGGATFDFTGRGPTWLEFNNAAAVGRTTADFMLAPAGPATAVPEPAMIGLFGLGALGLVASRRRKA